MEMRKRVGIEDLDRARHRDAGVVRVCAIELGVDDSPAIEMNDGLVVGRFPAADQSGGALVVLADDAVADGVEVLLVDGDPLACFRRRYPPHDGKGAGAGRGGDHPGNNDERGEGKTETRYRRATHSPFVRCQSGGRKPSGLAVLHSPLRLRFTPCA
jgi:hypothetical protein